MKILVIFLTAILILSFLVKLDPNAEWAHPAWLFRWLSPQQTELGASATYGNILLEHNRCKDWGGRFYFDYDNISWTPRNIATFNCTKEYTEGNKQITERLFEYEIDLP